MERVHTFAVVLEPEEEGGFTVRVLSLPEIVTFGKDEDEALAIWPRTPFAWFSKIAWLAANRFRAASLPRVREVTVTLVASAGGCRRSGLVPRGSPSSLFRRSRLSAN